MVQEASNHLSINMDAFSDGQMASKIWLSDQLFQTWGHREWPRLIIFGSWYGLLPYVLKLRNACDFQKLVLCDVDAESLEVSLKILNHWICAGLSIETICADCNQFPLAMNSHDLVINTSCEHIDSLDWWQQLPKEINFILQSTDMKHPTHVRNVDSLDSWKSELGPITKIFFEGNLHFSYPDKSFNRWMILGSK